MDIKLCDNFFYRYNGEDIFTDFNTSQENILRNNKNIKMYAGEWIKIKQNDFITHIVKPVETLKDIANRYNKTEEQILKENDLKTNKLFIGQILKIYK